MRIKWLYEDDYEACSKVMDVFVVKRMTIEVPDFINTYLNGLVEKFGYLSVEAKIRNIKYLLEKYSITNSLKCSVLSNYSKQNEMAFNDVKKVYGF